MFRCPTCIAVLPDPRAHRCAVCGQNLRRRRPRLLGSASPQVWATPTLRSRSTATPASTRPATTNGSATAAVPEAGPPPGPAPAREPAHEPPATLDATAPAPEPAPETPPVPANATPPAPVFTAPPPEPHPAAAPEPVPPVDPEASLAPPVTPGPALGAPAAVADSLRDAVVAAEHDGDDRHARVATQERIDGPWLTDLRRAWDPPDPTLQTYSRRRRWWDGVREWLG